MNRPIRFYELIVRWPDDSVERFPVLTGSTIRVGKGVSRGSAQPLLDRDGRLFAHFEMCGSIDCEWILVHCELTKCQGSPGSQRWSVHKRLMGQCIGTPDPPFDMKNWGPRNV